MFEPKPELVAKKWFIRIEQSPTVDMLKEIGSLLANTSDLISCEDKQTARDLYVAKMRLLKGASRR
jgi:hypothetical protein